MNEEQPGEARNHWFAWVIGCLVLLSAVVVLLKSAGTLRRATVTIDANGTARLGGMFPIQNKIVRDVALTAAGRLNGGTASIVAAKSTAISNLVEMCSAMRKSGFTSVVLQTELISLQQRPERKER